VSRKAERFRPATRSPSSSSGTGARRFIGLLLIAAVALAGCGGGSHQHKPSGPQAAHPQGELSSAEYRAIEREYARLHPLQDAKNLSGAAKHAESACSKLSRPDTRLVQLVQQDCRHALAFFSALGALQSADSQCQSQADLASCIADRYSTLGTKIRATIAGGLVLNQELARRGITGLCAQSIGIRRRDVTALRAAAVAATSAAATLGSGDEAGFSYYTKQLDKAFAAQDSHDALQGIRSACRPGAAPPKQKPHVVPGTSVKT
jgi:hypothetical protein